ncbi:transporter substrate-binding domain-containing protein [Congregicoccus parvus]|uniref:transporter substrate-binding domain-containing protein n=1 Tax=Congregicoccus parvus TaxID=3081749 RepID=UPI003FA5DC83
MLHALIPLLAHGEERIVRVGVLVDNHPYSFADQDGHLRGYVVDLMAGVERHMALRLERVFGTTAEINDAFVRGELDLLQSYAESPSREDYADFSVPYLEMAGSIIARTDEKGISVLEDLRGRSVLVHRDSLGESLLLQAGMADSIVHVRSVEDALRKLQSGVGDATLASRLTAQSTIHRLRLDRLGPVGEPVPGYRVRYCFAVRDGDRELLAAINEGLAILQRTGEAERIYRKWFGHIDPLGYGALDIALAVSAGLFVALLIALWAFVHQRRLRSRIAQQAHVLRESEARLRAVFEGSRDGFLVLERTTIGHTLLARCNPAAWLLLGRETPPEPSAPVAAVVIGGVEEDTLRRWLEDAAAPPHEHTCRRSGEERTFQLFRQPIAPRLDLVVARDLTHEKRAAQRLQESEERLRQSQKLEAIGTLASGIAHDFNNILTTVITNAEVVLMDMPADHPDAPCVAEIVAAGHRAGALVRQILTFSRRAEARREVLHVTPIAREVLRFIRATAPSTITLSHKVGDRSPPIEADPIHIHQVLVNLCTNAIHAMRDTGGTLEVTENAVVIRPTDSEHDGLTPGDYLHLSVRDTGAGMTSDILQHVFEPFFTTKPVGEGTGLGLAVVHGIVKSCHGAITVVSRPGEGTCFHLYFPEVEVSPPPREAGSDVRIPTGRGECVMFVDDEEAIVSATALLLRKLGYTACTFTDPRSALEALEQDPTRFAAVVTDLTMPRASGLELAAGVRAIDPGKPVLIASGFFGERDLSRAAELRVGPLLEKPLTHASLGTALAGVLADGHAAH